MKLLCLYMYLVQHLLHQIKSQQLNADLDLYQLLRSTEKRMQGLFKAFMQFSSTFQGLFYFPVLFKKALLIQVLFKHVGTLKGDGGISDLVECNHTASSILHVLSMLLGSCSGENWQTKGACPGYLCHPLIS